MDRNAQGARRDMESLDFIDADTLKLTIIPGLIVLVVLFLWFRRSEPKVSTARERDMQRSRFAGADEVDDGYDVALVNEGIGGKAAPRYVDQNDYIADPLDDWEPPVASRPEPKVTVKKAPAKAPVAEQRSAPPAKSAPAESVASEQDLPEQTETVDAKAPPQQDGLILVLNVVGNNHTLRGSQILKALTATGMSFGKMNIFHYVGPNRPANRPLFSVANMMEPGSFNLTTMEELATPGLILFANIARPEEAMATFSLMLETARQLARTLDGLVCDEKRSTLTKQGIDHIHSRIADFQRRSRLAQAANA